jgi:hypothetical protein
MYLPLAQLELAHTLPSTGDPAGATQRFTQLRTLWQHADPAFPPPVRLRAYDKTARLEDNE